MKKLRNSIIIALCLTFIVSAISTIFSGLLTVKADTHNYNIDYTSLSYTTLDTVTRRAEKPDKSPQITVFSYGCGGNLSHWSNNSEDVDKLERNNTDPNAGRISYTFEYEEDSIINRYVNKFIIDGNEQYLLYKVKTSIPMIGDVAAPQTNLNFEMEDFQCVYRGSNNSTQIIGDKTIEFTRLSPKTIKENNKDKIVYDNISEDTSLPEDIEGKHIILLFDIKGFSDASNDYVYAQLEFILDVISYQYCKRMNELPIYNLIGHSRGGITNLQYALGHPNNVASLYSMGTPYNGTNFGTASYNGRHLFVEMANMDSNSNGVEDIINSTLHNAYKTLWNTGYNNGDYSHIKFVPIGSYVTAGFLFQLIAEYLTYILPMDVWSEFALRGTLVLIELLIDKIVSYTGTGTSRFFKWARNKMEKAIDKHVSNLENRAAWHGILKSITANPQYFNCEHINPIEPHFLYIEDDLFINLDSQVANGYIGANPVVKQMDTSDQLSGKKSANAPGVAHNLETHDEDIIAYILANIDTSGRAPTGDQQPSIGQQIKNGVVYTYTIVGDEVVITGISGGSETLEIPDDLVDGKNITRIESGVFEALTQTYSMRSSTVNEITEITLPSTVERIDPYAFADMTSLQTVTINSSSGVSVGAEAFAGCTSLSTVNLGNVTEIGYGAFANCNSLTNITIPANITKIEDYAFYNTNIEQVSFSNSITEIGRYAFAKCSNLENVTIPATVTKIDDFAFYNSGISNLNFEAGSQLTEIGHYAFANSAIVGSVSIPSTVATIGRGAFMNATSLTSVDFGGNESTNAVISIDDLAFYGCSNLSSVSTLNVRSIGYFAFGDCTSLSSMSISAGVQSIGTGAFYGCSQIAGFSLAGASDYFHVVDGVLYVKQTNADETIEYYLHSYPIAKTGTEYTAIASLVGVLDYAFAGNVNLTTINLANVQIIGSSAFEDCITLAEVNLSSNLTDIGDSAFNGCTSLYLEEVPNVNSIGSLAFAGCNWTLEENETSRTLTIPASVQSIGAGAFYGCSQIAGFSLASGNNNFHVVDGVLYVKQTNEDETVEYYLHTYPIAKTGTDYTAIASLIGVLDYAFAGNVNLTTINLANVQDIGENAFEDCTNLTTITVDSANEYYSTSDGVLFNKDVTCLICYPLGKTNPTYTIPTTVTEITAGAFAGNVNLTTINLSNVQDIGENAFEDCTNLTTITVDSTNEYYSTRDDGVLFNKDVTCLIYYPLGKTDSTYTIPTTVTEITAGAFAGNVNLTTINLSNVQDIGANAFEGCTSLTTITVDSTNEYYSTSDGVLFNKDDTCLIYYPLGKTNQSYTVYITVTEITAGAFAGNTNLTSVNLTNVQIIGDNAFAGCTNLATITGNSVIEAHSSAFEGTAWYNTQSQAEYFGLGKVLFKYNGSYDASGVLDLRTYATIEENAFPNLNEEGEYIPNTQLATVYLGEDYSQFNYLSFNNCTALTKVYLLNSEVVQINALTDTLKEQLTFYVPYSLYSSYTATYEDLSFEAIQTTINFYVGEELLDTQTAYYGEVFTTDKVPTVTGNNIFLGWYDTTAYTSTFVGSTYEEFEEEDDLYAKILPTYTLRFVSNGATVCSDITGVYDVLTVTLPTVEGLNYYCWKNNSKEYGFSANLTFISSVFVADANNSYVITFEALACTHTLKKYVSISATAHSVICNTCGYTTSSAHVWLPHPVGKYKCKFCQFITGIIPINPLKVEDEEIIQSLGEAEEGEIITAPNGLSYIYLNGEFYLITQQEDLLFIPKNEESE